MAQVKYVGQYEAVWVPLLGRDVANGEVIDVDDGLAVSLGAQAGNWERVGEQGTGNGEQGTDTKKTSKAVPIAAADDTDAGVPAEKDG